MNMIVILEPFLFYSLPTSLMRVSTHVASTNYARNFASPYRIKFSQENIFLRPIEILRVANKTILEKYYKCNINLTSCRRQCRGAICFMESQTVPCLYILSCTFVHMLRNKFIFADALGAAKTMSNGEQS